MELTCPKCRSVMRQYERSGIVIDQCESCRGIFLDRGELEKLVDAENRYHSGAQSHVPPPPPPPHAPQPYGAPPPPPPAPHGGWHGSGWHGHRYRGHRHGHKRRRSFLDGFFD